MHSMFAVANTPQAIIVRINQEVARSLHLPEVKDRLFNIGIEVVGSSPQQLAATMKLEMARTGKLIRDKGIRAQ
jgi:tripartite-type tricarboxylate transporter receptor subunit TctC